MWLTVIGQKFSLSVLNSLYELKSTFTFFCYSNLCQGKITDLTTCWVGHIFRKISTTVEFLDPKIWKYMCSEDNLFLSTELYPSYPSTPHSNLYTPPGMPFALHEAGFGVGIALLALVVFVADRSLILLIKAGRLAEAYTYQELVEVSFGRPGYYLCAVLQFMYPFIGQSLCVSDQLQLPNER